MSVKVSNLTKNYGSQSVVDNISFEINKGEIVGFLGPNGAGKTTTMKILTCFVPQTSGEAYVNGFNVLEDEQSVKKCIGYLPEHNPLYTSMYVIEYLEFIASLHKLKRPRERVMEMVELTGLQKEKNKLISSLSKGYRQRVGLAQAMIHDPDVLILDEPTSGLDPNQLEEIREVIRSMKTHKTVIFSTHIMQEIQAVCDRVLIINEGKLIADDPIEKLKDRVESEEVLVLKFDKKLSPDNLKRLRYINKVEQVSEKEFVISASSHKNVQKQIFNFAMEINNPILKMESKESSVEDIFQKLTAKGK